MNTYVRIIIFLFAFQNLIVAQRVTFSKEDIVFNWADYTSFLISDNQTQISFSSKASTDLSVNYRLEPVRKSQSWVEERFAIQNARILSPFSGILNLFSGQWN
ncbi:MAG TPA: hypothetical protein PK006_10030 [Saprospiraceae bacterium]|nr:hypothetical protein [Saprospiraceae bacterium]